MSLRFRHLTRAAIRALPAGGAITEHGITVLRSTNGDVRYSVNVMIDRQRVHRVIGRESEGVTREQAERAIEAFRTKAREGRLDLPTGRKTHRNFAEGAAEYLERLTVSGGKNMKDKRRHLDRYLVPYFKGYRVDRVPTFAVQHYARKRVTEGAKQATVNRELATLSHFFNSMARWKWIKLDDRPAIQKEFEPRKQVVILSREHREALMQAALGDQDPQAWLFIAIGLNSAMRHGEILRIKFEETDFLNNRIYVPQAKAGQRTQPITPSLSKMLQKEREQRVMGDGYIFYPSRSGGALPHRASMAKQFQRCVIRAGLDPQKVTPHVMRHTAITTLVQAGVDLPTIQQISGHKTLAMVLRYVHLTSAHIDTAIGAIDTGMIGADTPELHSPAKCAA